MRTPPDETALSRRVRLIANAMVAVSIVFSAIIAILIATSLLQSRSNLWKQTQRSSENVAISIVNAIADRVDLYRFVLDSLIEDLGDPGIQRSPSTERRMIERAAAVSDRIGGLMVLDRDGNVVLEAGHDPPRRANYRDRDYFRFFSAQRDGAAEEVYVGAPDCSQPCDGDPSVAFGVRRSGEDGAFLGVAVMALGLEYFVDILSGLDLGPGGVVTIVRSDGKVLSRNPSSDGRGDPGRDVSTSPVFQRIAVEKSGAFVGHSQIDGIDRLYAFGTVPNAAIFVSVATSVDAVLSSWRARAWLQGGVTVAISVVAVSGAVFTRRELIRRACSEAALAALSITDPLTGLANRRRFDEALAREWRRAHRTGAPLGLLMIDADHFKLINDRLGHSFGDEVLKRIAAEIGACIRRPGDTAARVGGEEFAVILPDTVAAGADRVAEAIRTRIGADPLDPSGETRVTVSVGVVATVPTAAIAPSDLVAAADRALYEAKRSGRNRVTVGAVV